MLILFPRHRYHSPQDHTDGFSSDSCQACALSFCETCRGGEGDLPTACPQRVMTIAERAAIFSGHLDYVLGGWIVRKWLLAPLPERRDEQA